MNEAPFTFGEATQASDSAKTAQHNAEKYAASTSRTYADAERAYRKALALKIVELRAEGQPTTLAGDLARGDRHVADLKYARDVAEGVWEVAKQSAWRHTANRKDLLAFIDWSRARDLAEDPPVPEGMPVIGGRRAA